MIPTHYNYMKEKWNTVRLCGEGTFSQCFHIRNSYGVNYAIKVYKPDKKYELAFRNEVQMLSLVKFRCKTDMFSYIVNYIDVLTVSKTKGIVLELLGCNLMELFIKNCMKGFSVYLVQKILHDLLSAAVFLEKLGIVHGDIKPGNVLWNMNSGCFQIIDLSVSFKSGLPHTHQPLQSPGYQAPEVLVWNRKIKGKSLCDDIPSSSFGISIDMWSIGCVLMYVITGQQLYPTEHAQKLPILCTNCESRCGPCVHQVRSRELITAKRNELLDHDMADLAYITPGLLHCIPGNRFRANCVLRHPFLAANQSAKATITDLLVLSTRVLRLLNMFDESENIDDILSDIKEECEKFGQVVSVKTVRKDGYNVYVEYKRAEDCCDAQTKLTGRFFDHRMVVATFFPSQHFQEENLY